MPASPQDTGNTPIYTVLTPQEIHIPGYHTFPIPGYRDFPIPGYRDFPLPGRGPIPIPDRPHPRHPDAVCNTLII